MSESDKKFIEGGTIPAGTAITEVFYSIPIDPFPSITIAIRDSFESLEEGLKEIKRLTE